MSATGRRAALLIIAAALTAGVLAYGVTAFVADQQRTQAPSAVDAVAGGAPPSGERIVFRNTADGSGYGQLAVVPLDDPGGARTLLPIACDRVDATATLANCLHVDRGIVTTFNATLYDAAWQPVKSWPLAGIPSRTRLSHDGQLIATTAFVTGHGYATVGFSTQTLIASAVGVEYGNLEQFSTTIDGEPLGAADRNLWGVTFAADDNTFYATVASAGRTWLARGDLAARTLVSIAENAECPSLSPDGSLIAYKKNVSTDETAIWSIAVRPVTEDGVGDELVLPEKRNVDDQVEWLDQTTLLYGLPGDAVGDSAVWSIPVDGSAAGTLFIDHAWSPAVVR